MTLKAIRFICIALLFGLVQSAMAQEEQSMSFQDGVNGYMGTRDTWIDGGAPDVTHGGDNDLNVDGGDESHRESTLLSWDLTGIASGSTISSVQITFEMTNASIDTYEFYEMKRSWIEGEATYNIYASGQNWEVSGANGSADKGSTVLAAISPSSQELITITLNAAGVAMVQSWVDNPSTNHGFIIMDFTNSDGADFSSRETTVPPKMTIVYTPPPDLTVTSPNGGEIWEVGSVHDITWNSMDPGGTVKLEYSTDNGLNWSTIIASTEDDGIQPWTVPGTPTYQALVRVSDTDVSGPSDISDMEFVIASGPTLIVSSPNGGEDWECGSIQNINWSSLGTSGMVKIEYSTDTGFNWNDITTTDDDGTEPWLVPQTPTSQALVRVSDTNMSGPSDVSDAVFTLTSPPQEEAIIFSATGDIPQGSGDYAILQQQIADHNLYSPSEFFVHVGDIKEQTTICPESYYNLAANILKELAVPVFIVPGDNGTSDCSNEAEAWAFWVQYFMDFELNFCGAPFAERQTARPENLAFVSKGVLFIGIHLTSSSDPIMADDADWVEQQFTNKVSQVRGAVVFTHRGPGSSSLSPFFDRFVAAAQTFAKPILFLHGHGHSWIEDHYWSSAPNVLRIQVDNGGSEEPVQITVTMNDQDPDHMFLYLRDPLNPPLYNVMPCVEAGSDLQTNLASTADLQGKATDDGVPSPGTVTTTWSKISGPGNVTFSDPNSVTTSASFSFPGNYLLSLTADDGAMQNHDELTVEVTDVLVEAKIFLEGPYNSSTGEMTTELNTKGYLPEASPYSEDPRSITPPIPADITDWVLVQLRETPAGPAVASRSALLRKDGRIVADNGITPIITMGVSTDFYYIVIKHRNHLAVMSTGSNQLSNISSTLYDFTSDISKFYNDGAKELEPGSGVWGMYGGNADNSDQDIFASDLAAIKVDFLLGLFGYYLTDVDMDGDVFASDYALGKINFLLGAFSTVP